MSNADMKSLKKLAELCRKIGITHFKNEMFEFTLSDYKPTKTKSIKSTTRVDKQPANNLDVLTEETLTPEQLMFYSSMDPLAGIES